MNQPSGYRGYAAVLGVFSCDSPAPSKPALCEVGDLTSSMNPSDAKEVVAEFGSWVQNAIECKMGEYVIDVPAQGGSGEILVSRNGRTFMHANSKARVLLDDSGERIMFEWRRDQDTRPSDFVSYEIYDSARNAFITNMDAGPDGNIEMRWTEIAGQPRKTEVPIAGRWLEVVTRDGQTGTTVDGQFMSVEDTKARLESK